MGNCFPLTVVVRKNRWQPGRGHLQDTKQITPSLSSVSGTIQCRTRPESSIECSSISLSHVCGNLFKSAAVYIIYFRLPFRTINKCSQKVEHCAIWNNLFQRKTTVPAGPRCFSFGLPFIAPWIQTETPFVLSSSSRGGWSKWPSTPRITRFLQS